MSKENRRHMKRALLGLLFGLSANFATSGTAQATIILSSTGLATANLVTFEEIVLAQGAPVTTEYAGLGITFTAGVKYDANGTGNQGFPGFSGLHHVGNFFPATNPWSVLFGTSQSIASFGLATNPNTTTITAYLAGSLVESATFSTTFNNAATGFVQLTNITFDEIRLSTTGDGLAIIDNVAFTNVPEPGLLGLLGLGLAAFAARRKRRATG